MHGRTIEEDGWLDAFCDPAPAADHQARRTNLVDATGRVIQIRVAGRGDSGEPDEQDLVDRISDTYIPAARFPASTDVLLTGAAAFGVDFIDRRRPGQRSRRPRAPAPQHV